MKNLLVLSFVLCLFGCRTPYDSYIQNHDYVLSVLDEVHDRGWQCQPEFTYHQLTCIHDTLTENHQGYSNCYTSERATLIARLQQRQDACADFFGRLEGSTNVNLISDCDELFYFEAHTGTRMLQVPTMCVDLFSGQDDFDEALLTSLNTCYLCT